MQTLETNPLSTEYIELPSPLPTIRRGDMLYRTLGRTGTV
jgi:hypothetical protein